jgi:hypothetical protein
MIELCVTLKNHAVGESEIPLLGCPRRKVYTEPLHLKQMARIAALARD